MSTRVWQLATAVFAILFAGAGAYGLSQSRQAATARQMTADAQAALAARPDIDPAQMAALDSRIAELESALIQRDRTISRLNEEVSGLREQPKPRERADNRQAPEGDGERRERGRRGRGNVDWAEWREKNPEQAEQMRDRMRQVTAGIAGALQQQADLLAPIDVTRLPADMQEGLRTYREELTELQAIVTRLQAEPEEGAEGENPMELQGQLWRGLRELQPRMQVAQEAALYDLGYSLGYTEETVPQFVAKLREIQDGTTIDGLTRTMRR